MESQQNRSHWSRVRSLFLFVALVFAETFLFFHFFFCNEANVEYCPGGNLAQNLRKPEYDSLSGLLPLLTGIACGMLHLHKEKIIHRDLAPRNILVTHKTNKK
jgi:serine/threonine protein kinase